MTNLISNIKEFSVIIQSIATLFLVIVTIIYVISTKRYVILTKKILKATHDQTIESMRNSLNTNKIELMKLKWEIKADSFIQNFILGEIDVEIKKIEDQLSSLEKKNLYKRKTKE